MIRRGGRVLRASLHVISAALRGEPKRWEATLIEELRLLGPVYTKLGQLLSTRDDVVGPQLAGKLRALCAVERAGKISDDVRGRLDAACRRARWPSASVDELFDGPISLCQSASLADVYHARSPRLGEVAIKILRPEVLECIRHDKTLLLFLARLISPTVYRVVEELFRALEEECDFLVEAANCRTFGALLVQQQRCRCISAPRVLFADGAAGVLIMQWCAVSELQLSAPLLKCGMKVCTTQLLQHGFLHGDPHRGNLKVDREGRLVFLDFGLCVRLPPRPRELLLRWILAIAADDAAHFREASRGLGCNLSLSETRKLKTFQDLQFHTVPEGPIAVALRSMVMLEGLALAYDPHFKVLEACVPLTLEISEGHAELAPLRRKVLQKCFEREVWPRSDMECSPSIMADPQAIEVFVETIVGKILRSVLDGRLDVTFLLPVSTVVAWIHTAVALEDGAAFRYHATTQGFLGPTVSPAGRNASSKCTHSSFAIPRRIAH